LRELLGEEEEKRKGKGRNEVLKRKEGERDEMKLFG
jgi:hypothetical protein